MYTLHFHTNPRVWYAPEKGRKRASMYFCLGWAWATPRTCNIILRKPSSPSFSLCLLNWDWHLVYNAVAKFHALVFIKYTAFGTCEVAEERGTQENSYSLCVESHWQCRCYSTHISLQVEFSDIPKPFNFFTKPWPNSTVDCEVTSRLSIQFPMRT